MPNGSIDSLQSCQGRNKSGVGRLPKRLCNSLRRKWRCMDQYGCGEDGEHWADSRQILEIVCYTCWWFIWLEHKKIKESKSRMIPTPKNRFQGMEEQKTSQRCLLDFSPSLLHAVHHQVLPVHSTFKKHPKPYRFSSLLPLVQATSDFLLRDRDDLLSGLLLRLLFPHSQLTRSGQNSHSEM